MQGHRINFGPFAFDSSTMTLWRDGALLPLGRRGAALLLVLLETGGGVASKETLLERGWPETIVEESNLVVQMATLRKTLGPRPDGKDWIVNVPRVGYRLLRDTGQESPPAVAGGRPALAVLPFVNMSADASQQHFADGLVEDMITAFSRFTSFAVVARQSSFAFRDRALDVREIAAALGVRYVLEGSVRREGRSVRINAQLIDGISGAHIWAEKLDGTIDDVFAFQDRVTSSVIARIEPHIMRSELERARRKPPGNLDAYDLYLRALALSNESRDMNFEQMSKEIELLEEAVVLDPNFAPILAEAAWAYEKRLTRGGTPPGMDDAKRAIELAEQALQADENDPMAMLVAGVVLVTIKKDTATGHALVRRAAALNPNSPVMVTTAGYIHWILGDLEEAIDCYERSIALAPAWPEARWTLGGLSRLVLCAGGFEQALARGW